jgi:hypothetical protein
VFARQVGPRAAFPGAHGLLAQRGVEFQRCAGRGREALAEVAATQQVAAQDHVRARQVRRGPGRQGRVLRGARGAGRIVVVPAHAALGEARHLPVAQQVQLRHDVGRHDGGRRRVEAPRHALSARLLRVAHAGSSQGRTNGRAPGPGRRP